MEWQNLALLFVTAVTVASLQAQTPTPDTSPSASPGGKHRWGGHHAWIWQKLNLTDAQKQQIRTIRQTNKNNPALLAYLQAKKKVQDDVKANQGVRDEDALTLGKAEAQLEVLREQQQNQIKAILNPDQLQTWNEFQAKRESFLQKRMENLTAQPNP